MSLFINQRGAASKFSSADSWVLLTPIEKRIKEKLELSGTPLKDWNINIYRGVLTGYNEAFIIDGKKKDELVTADPKSAEIIRPILRGRDIKRYGYEYADLWLIYIPWHFPLQDDPNISGASDVAEDVFMSSFPAIYNHLLSYKKDLENRNKAETGIRYEWYAMQRWGANYWEDFFKQKIVWAETMRIHKNSTDRFPRFGYDKEGIYITDKTCFFATGEKIEYIMAFFNSIIGRYLCSQYVSILDDGGYLMQKIYLENIPIPDFELQLRLITNEILNTDPVTDVLEDEIDKILFDLYQFSEDEINFIRIHNC